MNSSLYIHTHLYYSLPIPFARGWPLGRHRVRGRPLRRYCVCGGFLRRHCVHGRTLRRHGVRGRPLQRHCVRERPLRRHRFVRGRPLRCVRGCNFCLCAFVRRASFFFSGRVIPRGSLSNAIRTYLRRKTWRCGLNCACARRRSTWRRCRPPVSSGTR